MDRPRLNPKEAVALDVFVVVAFGALGVWREQHQVGEPQRLIAVPLWVRIAVQILGAAALMWRRSRPLSVGGLTAVLSLVSPLQSATVAAYSIMVHGRGRRIGAALVAVIIGCYLLGGQVWALDDRYSAALGLGLATSIGLYVAARRRLYDALIDQANRSERERNLLSEQAVSRERERLGQQMHDVITHRLTLMVLQAGALAVTAADADSRRAADQLRRTGVSALGELNDVFRRFGSQHDGVDTDAYTAPDTDRGSDTTMTVRDLVSYWREAGADVRLDEVGDLEDLDASTRQATFQVVAEAITNAAKHAPGSTIDTDLRCDGDGVTVEICNGPPREGARSLGIEGRGSGLAGLRRQLELLNGVLEHGGTTGGGFRLHAQIPRQSVSPK